nr:flagellar protein FlaG [Clostridium paraputrificum]
MDMKVIGGQTNLNVVKSNMEVNSVEKELTTNAEKEERYTKENLDKAIKKLNGFLKDDNAYAEYNVHEKFGDIMIKIVDRDTKEVLVEVPPKKILDMIAKLCEISGVVFDKKA